MTLYGNFGNCYSDANAPSYDDAGIKNRISTLEAVGILGTYTVATLPAASSSNLGRQALVSDLFGISMGMVRSCKTSDLYYWRPEGPDSGTSIAASADMTINPLTYPQSIALSGTIGVGVTRNFTLGTSLGWPGCTKEIKATMPTILGNLNILGTGLGSGVSVLAGGYKKFVLDYSTGSLSWVQLV